jgi:hypothetical protein
MAMNEVSADSITTSARTIIATSHLRARRVGTWVGLAFAVSIASGALRAEESQAIGTWASAGDAGSSISNGAIVALPDKRTLIVGGKLADGTLSDAVTIYDPVTKTVIAAGRLTSSRVDHTATLLRDGRVLVVGGIGADGRVSSDIEVFDPPTGTSTIVALLPEPRSGHVAAALLDGTVVMAGGATVDVPALETVVLFDPSTAAVSSMSSRLQSARVHASATTLLDGRVLVVGGSNGTTDLASAEIYERNSQSFSMAATAMSVGRQGHAAVLLPDNGGVLVAGGTSNGVTQTSVDLFLPAVFPDPFSYGEGEFTATGAMTAARAGAVAGPTSVEGYAFAAGGGSAEAEVYRYPTIKTDKDDYAPGELATITGWGWQANEEVTLFFQEDPAVHDDYVVKVAADGNGHIFWNQWAPEHHDIGVRFYLTATDSRSRAQMTFTDASKLGSASVGTQTGVLTSGTGGSASYTVTVNRSSENGSTGAFDATLAVTSQLPPGVTASFTPATLNFLSKENSKSSTLTLQTSATTAEGTSAFTVRAAVNASDFVENVGTLTIGQPTQSATTTTVTCSPSVGYSGAAQTPCTAFATGAGGFKQALTVFYTANINVGTATASASFEGDASHGPSTGNATFTIDKANAVCTITGYSGTFNGAPHGASGSCVGANGDPTAAGSTLDLGPKFTNAPGGTAHWTFTGGSNYHNTQGDVAITISKATATVAVEGYAGVYDGASHGATGTAEGVLNEPLAGLNLGTSFSNVPGGTAHWVFADVTGNYHNAEGDVAITISKATATVAVEGYSGVFDGAAHGATGTAKGVLLEPLAGLDLGTSFSDVPGGTAHWTFTNLNYESQLGDVQIVINKASSTTTVGCPGNVTFAGEALTPCTVAVVGAGGLNLSPAATYANNVNAGTATASYEFAGDTNHTASSDSTTFLINKANAMVTAQGYTGVYDGLAHGASGTAVGVKGEPLAGLSLGTTFTNVPGGTAQWAFTDQTGNYKNQSGDAVIAITKAEAAVIVNGYSGVYDAEPHGAYGQVKGVLGEALAGLNLGASFTNVPGGTAHWTFSDQTGNYNNKDGNVEITIYKADATCTVLGYDVIFDNASHTATGTCVGVANSVLAGLDLSKTTHTPAGDYTYDSWKFTDVTGNYNGASGTVVDRIRHWTTAGFYQPVDMSGSNIVWNTIKGGSTVPLKFNLYAGSANRTSVGDVSGFAFAPAPCETSMIDSAVEFTTTGGTQLRYDGTAGQFIQNWQTPKTVGKCYVVQLTALDASTIVAYFKTK